MSTPDSAVHVVFDHGDEQQWAEWLAACRHAVLSFFPQGHPFYEAWLAAAVSDPAEVPKLVQAFVYRMDRQRAENKRLRDGPFLLMNDDATVTALTRCADCGFLFRDIEQHVRESVTVPGIEGREVARRETDS